MYLHTHVAQNVHATDSHVEIHASKVDKQCERIHILTPQSDYLHLDHHTRAIIIVLYPYKLNILFDIEWSLTHSRVHNDAVGTAPSIFLFRYSHANGHYNYGESATIVAMVQKAISIL